MYLSTYWLRLRYPYLPPSFPSTVKPGYNEVGLVPGRIRYREVFL